MMFNNDRFPHAFPAALLQDLKYAIRRIPREPIFSVVAISTIAIGIAATSIVFSLVSAILLRPLPVEDPGSLITFEELRQGELANSVYSYPMIRDYREAGVGVVDIAAHGIDELTIADDGVAEAVVGAFVTGNYFDLLGIGAVRGRLIVEEDEAGGGLAEVAVISHRLWRSRFGGADVVGSTVRLNSRPVKVIGVTPAGFSGLDRGIAVDVWLPLAMYSVFRPGVRIDGPNLHWLVPSARLMPSMTLQQAGDVLSAAAVTLPSRPAQHQAITGVRAVPLTGVPSQFATPLRYFLGLLFTTAGMVLLIACVNVAGMLIARGSARCVEIATRLALGASRSRLTVQLLTESLVLYLLGGCAGLLITFWVTNSAPAIQARISSVVPLPIGLDLPLDRSIVAFALIGSLLTAVLFGLAPALRATRSDLTRDMKSSNRRAIAGRSRLRNGFVVTQIAVSVVLLIAAGLLVRSMQSVVALDSGMDPQGIAVADLDLGPHGYDRERGRQFADDLRGRLERNPAIQAVSFATHTTLDGSMSSQSFSIPGVEPTDGTPGVMVQMNLVDHRYFETVGIPVLAGRGFTEQDRSGSQPVAIINEMMARLYWPDGDAIGARISTGSTDYEIVGIARDAKYQRLEEGPRPFIYLAWDQNYTSRMVVHVASAGEGDALAAALLADAIRAADPNLPVLRPGSLEARITARYLPQRFGAAAIGLFGAVGLLLTTIGLYGVVAYTVNRRTPEIGVRIALGASKRELVGMVMWQGLVLLAIGLSVGLGLAAVLSRLLQSFLVQVSPTDPITFAAVGIMLLIVTLLASYLPARKAANVDPASALRAE